MIWLSCSAWFTELGLNAVLPWQETIASTGRYGCGEALLYRVYGGTNWYRIEALADTLETYDTQEDHRALIVSNRQQLGPAGGHGPAGGGAGKLGYDPFPAAVL